jgi:hypothetical protein
MLLKPKQVREDLDFNRFVQKGDAFFPSPFRGDGVGEGEKYVTLNLSRHGKSDLLILFRAALEIL